MSRSQRPPVDDDLAWLVIHGTDEELRAAASDPRRRKISVDEVMQRMKVLASAGISTDEAVAALVALGRTKNSPTS